MNTQMFHPGASFTRCLAVNAAITLAALRLSAADYVSMNSGVTTHLLDVWGTSPNNVWAVGAGGVILHYDGNLAQNWTRVGQGLTTLDLHTVTGNRVDNVYAASGSTTQGTVLLHFNGTSWSPLATLPEFQRVLDLWVAPTDELFAVGPPLVNQFASADAAVWKNGAWQEMWFQSPGLTTGAAAVAGLSATDVLAGLTGNSGTFRYDGNSLPEPGWIGVGRWSSIGVNNQYRELNLIVNQAPPHHLLAVSGLAQGATSFQVYSYQNGALTDFPVGFPTLTVGRPASAWGTSVQNIFLAGADTSGVAKLGRYNVNQWQNQSLPVMAAGTGLNGIHGFGTEDTFMVGEGGTIIRGQADLPATITIADASVVEGDAGTRQLVFNVTLSEPATVDIEVEFITGNGTALAGEDYTAESGTLFIFEDESEATITVQVNGDPDPEADETLTITLADPVNAILGRSQATGTIVDDDTPPTIYVTGGRVHEGDTGTSDAVFRVQMNYPWKAPVTVDFATTDTGIATPDEDYTPAAGTVSFAVGETKKTFAVSVRGDANLEPNETFGVQMSNPVNATLAYAALWGLIGDDDLNPNQGELMTVVKTGDPVPAEPGRFFRRFIESPVANNFNETVFLAITDTAENDQPRTGVWLGTIDGLQKIAEAGMAAPNEPPGSTYTGQFTSLDLDDDGNVLFIAGIARPGQIQTQSGRPRLQSEFPDPANVTVASIWRGIAGYVDTILRTGDPLAAGRELVRGMFAVGGTVRDRASVKSGVTVIAGEDEAGKSFVKVNDLNNGTSTIPLATGDPDPAGGSGTIESVGSGPINESRDVVVIHRIAGSAQPPNLANFAVYSLESRDWRFAWTYPDLLAEQDVYGVFPFAGMAGGGHGAFTFNFDIPNDFPNDAVNQLFRLTHDDTIMPGYIPASGGFPPPIIEAYLAGAGDYCTYNALSFLPGDPNNESGVRREHHNGTVASERVLHPGMTVAGGTVVNLGLSGLNIDESGFISVPGLVNDGMNNRQALLGVPANGTPGVILQEGMVNTLEGYNIDLKSLYVAPTAAGGPDYLTDRGWVFLAGNTENGSGDPAQPYEGLIAVFAGAEGTTIQFLQGEYTVTEGQTVSLTLTRSGDITGTSGVTVWLHNGSAKRTLDFTATPEADPVFVTFAPGEALKNVSIQAVEDAELEWTEFFHAYLKDFVNATDGIPVNARVAIGDNDGPPPSQLWLQPTNAPLLGIHFAASYSPPDGTGFVQRTLSLPGGFLNLPGTGNPVLLGDDTLDDVVHYISDFGNQVFLRLIDSVATGTIRGTARNPDGTPWAGIISIGDSELATGTDAQGNFRIENVPAGEVPICFWGIYSVTNPFSGQVEHFRVRVTVFVTLVAGQEAVVEAKVELPEEEELPPCDCVPWCGIVGGTFGGVQKVVAGGGKRGDCEDNPVVTVTGPGGINLPINGKRRMFSPAANGTWTVTASICGITKTCEITLP